MLYGPTAVERAMKRQEVILRAMRRTLLAEGGQHPGGLARLAANQVLGSTTQPTVENPLKLGLDLAGGEPVEERSREAHQGDDHRQSAQLQAGSSLHEIGVLSLPSAAPPRPGHKDVLLL